MKKILSLLCVLMLVLSACSQSVDTECVHQFTPASCEEASVCTICNAQGQTALGHQFENGVCVRENCGEKDPAIPVWYTEGDIVITEAQVDKILSMEYKKPKNVIVMIGDGMGANDIILAEKNKEGCFEFGLVLNKIKNTGYAKTRSNNSSVTDSAASATALATGYKTNNGYVGVSPQGENLKNISEIAREKGKKVGIVTNDSIVGATPSAFTVHNKSRDNSAELAKSFVEFMPDVLIGQGKKEMAKTNFSEFLFSFDFSGFKYTLDQDIRCEKPFLGVFSENITKEMSNMLAYNTEIALNRLKNSENGFFLMVENAATDQAGHNNDIKGKVNGVVTFDRAVAVVLKFMEENPDTLLIITSDHETGGVEIPEGEFKLDKSLFTTTSHTGVDVRTFAVGYGTEYFNNTTVDNTDIAKFAITALDY